MKASRFLRSKVAFCIAAVMCCATVLSCGNYMSNDEIIAQTKKCNDAGMKTSRVINNFNYKVEEIICEEK